MALGLLFVRLVVAAAVAAAVASGVPAPPGLAVGYYNESCPRAEELVFAEMQEIVRKDVTLAPALLRFMLHDCFVRVRASVLRFFVRSLLALLSYAASCPVVACTRYGLVRYSTWW